MILFDDNMHNQLLQLSGKMSLQSEYKKEIKWLAFKQVNLTNICI